jgi:hypothetical protein
MQFFLFFFLPPHAKRAGAIHNDPNQGAPSGVSSTESPERAHTRNFLDAVVLGAQINAPLEAGIEASLPIQMALKSYWSRETVSQSQLV